MARRNDPKGNGDLSRLRRLIKTTDARLKRVRVSAQRVCGRLAEEKAAPGSSQEEGWRRDT